MLNNRFSLKPLLTLFHFVRLQLLFHAIAHRGLGFSRVFDLLLACLDSYTVVVWVDYCRVEG